MKWAYLHENGKWLVKTYMDGTGIDCALESPFVQKVVGPAETNEELAQMIQKGEFL